MNDVVEIATRILSASERRLEIVSHNIANTGTAGFKKQVNFADLLSKTSMMGTQRSSRASFTDFSQGKLTETKSPLDLAITSSGMFKLRSGDSYYYSRQGQFSLDNEGHVITPQGYILQTMGGGDLILGTSRPEIIEDGTVLEGGLPVARIGVFEDMGGGVMESLGGTLYTGGQRSVDQVENPIVRQGMVEASNVEVADEMIEMMAAIRQAEIGARLVQTYDTLIGQAITTFGQGG